MSLLDRANKLREKETLAKIAEAKGEASKVANGVANENNTIPIEAITSTQQTKPAGLQPAKGQSITERLASRGIPQGNIQGSEQENKQAVATETSNQPHIQEKTQLQAKPNLSLRERIAAKASVQEAPESNNVAETVQPHEIDMSEIEQRIDDKIAEPKRERSKQPTQDFGGSEPCDKPITEPTISVEPLRYVPEQQETSFQRKERIALQTKVEALTNKFDVLQGKLCVQDDYLLTLHKKLTAQRQEIAALKKDEPL